MIAAPFSCMLGQSLCASSNLRGILGNPAGNLSHMCLHAGRSNILLCVHARGSNVLVWREEIIMRRAGYLGLLFVVVGLSWPSHVAATSWHVGLQAGHWRANELPDELSRLRSSTGTAAAGYREYQVNLDIAQRTATLLRAGGMSVDILPSTVPPSYQA